MAFKSTARKPANSYSQVQATTAGPGRRVVMMYDGILKNLRAGKALMADKRPENIETIHNHLQLAERLILELQLALDHDNGGQLATTLDGLYSFWISHISDANMHKDPEMLREIISMVKDLRDAWNEAARKARQQGIT